MDRPLYEDDPDYVAKLRIYKDTCEGTLRVVLKNDENVLQEKKHAATLLQLRAQMLERRAKKAAD